MLLQGACSPTYVGIRRQPIACLIRGFQNFRLRPKLLRKRASYVAERISGAIRNDELAFFEQLHRAMPIGNGDPIGPRKAAAAVRVAAAEAVTKR